MIIEHFAEVASLRLNPPLSWGISCVMFLVTFFLFCLYIMQGKPELGWDPGSKSNRILLLVVSFWFAYCGVSMLFEKSVSIRVVFLALAMGLWTGNMLREYWLKSRRHAVGNAEQVRQSRARLVAKGVRV